MSSAPRLAHAADRQPLAWLRLDPARLCSHESVGNLTFAELGLHASLLEPAWHGDGLPDDPSTLLPIRARGVADFKRLWRRVQHLWPLGLDGRRRNAWLEEQRAASIAIREQKAKNRRGSELRTDDRATPVEHRRPPANGR